MTPLDKIVLASSNSAKLKELQEILAPRNIELIPQSEFDIEDTVEDGLSFVENAIIKARHASKHTGMAALADDSGLEVDALNGEPGIFSARYAGLNEGREKNDAANNALLLENLKQVAEADRSARFQCCIALVRFPQDPMPLICQGTWEGRIMFSEVGSNGFGYDPLFYVPSHECASAELDPLVKNTISHRAQALQQLLACLTT
ncbi:RdgB/HAM1 family non-canonical purine NTP pyrophosphatase [Gammaproteobacteria bacterium]|nr:RdgB/HAM1 family non-canonical purine NTP pyrophosphatase [Gammaproteobacteria bacterium]